MSDSKKERLIGKEEGKGHMEDDYLVENTRMTTVPNVNFEMNQKTLVSPDIKPKDLRAKIEEYLESGGLTRDQVKLLLKQGAEDNYIFLLKEDTYDKLVDALGLKLDHDEDKNISDISGLLATARLEYNDRFSKAPNMMNLDSTANRFAAMMKSRQILRDKSVSYRPTAPPTKAADFRETNHSINTPEEDDDVRSETPEAVKDQRAQEVDPNLLERVPRISNQGLKNWLIVIGISIISILCFICWAIVTYKVRNGAFQIIGPGLLFSRGSALAILVTSNFLLLFVSYDFMTCCRPICARH